MNQHESTINVPCSINGNFKILKWGHVSTIFQAIFSGEIPIIGLILALHMVGTSNQSLPESWPLILKLPSDNAMAAMAHLERNVQLKNSEMVEVSI